MCSKMLVHVEIFQFQNMLNESKRYCDETNDLVKKHFFSDIDEIPGFSVV